MGCCGNRRAVLSHHDQTQVLRPPGATPGHAPGHVPVERVYFQYAGQTALNVRGTFSRQSYRFAAPGAVVAVDGRDAPSMAAVPLLRRVKPPEQGSGV